MGNIKTQDCEICHIQRQPSNHWFKVFIVDGGLIILGWEAVGPNGQRRDVNGKDYDPEKADAHLCGHNHVIEWMSKEFFGKAKEL